MDRPKFLPENLSLPELFSERRRLDLRDVRQSAILEALPKREATLRESLLDPDKMILGMELLGRKAQQGSRIKSGLEITKSRLSLVKEAIETKEEDMLQIAEKYKSELGRAEAAFARVASSNYALNPVTISALETVLSKLRDEPENNPMLKAALDYLKAKKAQSAAQNTSNPSLSPNVAPSTPDSSAEGLKIDKVELQKREVILNSLFAEMNLSALRQNILKLLLPFNSDENTFSIDELITQIFPEDLSDMNIYRKRIRDHVKHINDAFKRIGLAKGIMNQSIIGRPNQYYLELPESNENSKDEQASNVIVVDLKAQTISYQGNTSSISEETQWEVFMRLATHAGEPVKSNDLIDGIPGTGVHNRYASDYVLRIARRPNLKFPKDLITTYAPSTTAQREYTLNAEIKFINDSEQVRYPSTDRSDPGSIIVDYSTRTVETNGVKKVIQSDEQWDVFLQLALHEGEEVLNSVLISRIPPSIRRYRFASDIILGLKQLFGDSIIASINQYPGDRNTFYRIAKTVEFIGSNRSDLTSSDLVNIPNPSSAQNMTAELVSPIEPDLKIDGTVDLKARLNRLSETIPSENSTASEEVDPTPAIRQRIDQLRSNAREILAAIKTGALTEQSRPLVEQMFREASLLEKNLPNQPTNRTVVDTTGTPDFIPYETPKERLLSDEEKDLLVYISGKLDQGSVFYFDQIQETLNLYSNGERVRVVNGEQRIFPYEVNELLDLVRSALYKAAASANIPNDRSNWEAQLNVAWDKIHSQLLKFNARTNTAALNQLIRIINSKIQTAQKTYYEQLNSRDAYSGTKRYNPGEGWQI